MLKSSNFLARVALAPAVALAAICGAAATDMAPAAYDAWRRQTAPDTAALVDMQVNDDLSAARFSREFDVALEASDAELAQSLIELGAERGLSPGAAQQARLTALKLQNSAHTAHDFADGFVHGGGESGAGMAGALVGDLSGFGDARDLWTEAQRLSRGEEVDHVVMGMSAAGLALSAAAWSSLGAALPARGGLTLIKSTQKAGKLSRPLVAALSATAAKTIDREALTASLKAATRLDVEAAKAAAGRALRPEAFFVFRELGRDVAKLYQRTGARGVKQVLGIAADEGEIRAAARLAEARGGKTRAILAILGRGALSTAFVLMLAAQTLATFVVIVIGLALSARALGVTLARLLPNFFGTRPKDFERPSVQSSAN